MGATPDDDPLSASLALSPPRTVWRTLLLIVLLPPALCILLPLSVLLVPALLFLFAAWASWAAVCRPGLLRGLPRDVGFVVRLVRATKELKGRLNRTRGTFTTADYWADTVRLHGPKDALIFEGASWTYAQVDFESDRVARWALEAGVRAGDAVALLCANRPEHLFIWLGLAKVGAAATLVNGTLRGSSLQHALAQCSVRFVLFDGPAAAALEPLVAAAAIADGCGGGSPLRFVCIDAEATPSFATAMELPVHAEAVPAEQRAACRATDTLLYIFTSGTTGMPKAARLNHIRFFSAIVVPYMFRMRPSDRLYCCLPMCHTAAVGGMSICWWLGAPVILSRRFSARRFWRECAESRATIVQYVGELCRYLVHSPPSEYDRAHSVRVAFGNGLRPDVWSPFVELFGMKEVAEVYASTEGNANLANTVGKEGAVGFISPLLERMYPVRLIRLADEGGGSGASSPSSGDGATPEPLRTASGLCVLCKPGETGELLGLVNQRDPSRNFAGYTDGSATRRKLVRDVLKKGDCWFRTGDLMRTDADGFVYFADRMGDTFRYKGENVSTAEVAAVIGSLRTLHVSHCLVYGVALPQVDGRVGMAAVLVEEDAKRPLVEEGLNGGGGGDSGGGGGSTTWMSDLFEGLDAQLPAHAQPLFVRVLRSAESIDVTITFKPKKASLQAEGIAAGPSGIVFVRDARARTYVPLGDVERKRILEGGGLHAAGY
jgi:acyl-CoA synthetase (AMP-forming)/AMP-acid ligase II